MLGKIADRKDRLLHMEKKLATLDRTRLGKEVRCLTLVDYFSPELPPSRRGGRSISETFCLSLLGELVVEEGNHSSISLFRATKMTTRPGDR